MSTAFNTRFLLNVPAQPHRQKKTKAKTNMQTNNTKPKKQQVTRQTNTRNQALYQTTLRVFVDMVEGLTAKQRFV